ncbi:hypothetical protein IWW34DRAFT_709897 [Fusarium oxysporum f. sp. albedinis]|nr:hypothetical protein IWW34DRAFT_709897 [Fusarium oxysporum f. sp. albedinis]KAJ0126951.1 putative methyltransferase C1B3.06c [Fusarium oxysporum f. sp. albedinis]KAK2468518.1 hypothetical protein H9L39_20164 [Fusarium oxysporum f. sp. albedinis]
MSSASIRRWLRDIPDHNISKDHDLERPSKRPRHQHPVTPEPSEDCFFAEMPPAQQSPSKRQNLEISGDETADIDTTPRPKRSRPLRSESEHSLSSHLSYHSSQVSGQSSPRKQLQSLKLDARGIEFRDLVLFDDKPAELEDLLDAIDLVMEGKGIVSTLQQDALVSASKSSKAFKWAARGGDYFSEDRDAIGHTPSPEDVSRVLAAAAECSSNSHHEVNWNMEVHQPLLSLAFRPPDQLPYSHLVNFMGTTQASLIPDYTNSSVSKKVDFSIYIEPGNDSSRSAKDAISRCQRDLPESVFNFTDAAPLAHRPIAFSIETKKPSAGFDGAKLQLGIWQNAHWTFLRHLAQIVGEKCTAARPETITNTGDKVIMKKASDLPTFIPGIIIQGHFWHLIITTPQDRKTMVWQSIGIGNTQSTKGIYQIVCILHLLRQWVKDTYWPLVWEMVRAGWPGQ